MTKGEFFNPARDYTTYSVVCNEIELTEDKATVGFLVKSLMYLPTKRALFWLLISKKKKVE